MGDDGNDRGRAEHHQEEAGRDKCEPGCVGRFEAVLEDSDPVDGDTRGGPGNATELLGIYIYNQGFQYFELGYGSAAAMIMLLISLGFAFIYMRLMRVEL